MAYAIGEVTKSGGDDCHYQMLGVIKTLAEANGWVTLRYIDTGEDRELILKGEGLSGTEEIYCGFKTYQSITADYYNIAAGVFTGYVAGNSFESQPSAKLSGIPAHNNAIAYWITCNPQRITGCMRVGTPVYEHFYVGKCLPYARPSEFPYPVICGGMLSGKAATRFSDLAHSFPYTGQIAAANLFIREFNGNWTKPTSYPWLNQYSTQYTLAGSSVLVPIGDTYQVEPVIMYESRNDINPKNVWGELDGIYFCSGFNNAVENVVQIGGSSVIDQSGLSVLAAVNAIKAVSGRAFVMCQNVHRTAWKEYIALEMK